MFNNKVFILIVQQLKQYKIAPDPALTVNYATQPDTTLMNRVIFMLLELAVNSMPFQFLFMYLQTKCKFEHDINLDLKTLFAKTFHPPDCPGL